MSRKVVLVTGASSGIGKATALQLNKEGYIVYGAARRVKKMNNELAEQGINVLYLDLTEDKSIVDCVDSIIKKEGRIDILINNAGRGDFGTMEETPLGIARAQYEVNVFGLARMTQLVLPCMRKNKSGKIVNIASVGGKIVTPFGGWYQSTKFAVEALSDATRMEIRHFGIDVIVIEPGAIKTAISKGTWESIRKISGDGFYKDSAKKASNALNAVFAKGSSPDVIAKTISKAIKAKNPKTRYAAGYRAKSMLDAKKSLSDKAYDKMIMREFM